MLSSWYRAYAFCSLSLLAVVYGAILQPQIPSIASFSEVQGEFKLSPLVQVVVDSESADLGSPSLLDFAQTFQQDLKEAAHYVVGAPVRTSKKPPTTHSVPTIYLSVDPSLSFSLYNGEPTNEGYNFEIDTNVYTIRASAPIGVWWGTRTLLQQAALQLAQGSKMVSFPAGKGSDSPGWEVRGFMLDAGRHWFETSFLGISAVYVVRLRLTCINPTADLCIYASFFKINELHLHASDNLWNPTSSTAQATKVEHLYAAVRFQPPPDSPINESWSEADFRAMQATCAAYGVAPELMEDGAPDHLNLSHPDTIPTVKAIWDEFLPWRDEYDAALANDYIASNKSIRVWGTYEPSTTRAHWDFPGDSIPVQLLAAGYRVINSEQAFLYLDGKTSDSGQPAVDLRLGPNIFSLTDPSNNTAPDAPGLRGSIFALWSDWGNNASTALEAYYQLSRSTALFAEKAWAGAGVRASALDRAQFAAAYPPLNAAAPGQNLNRVVAPAHANVVFEHAGEVPAGGLRMGVPSVGPPYTLAFGDSKLHAANLTFEATGQLYALGRVLVPGRWTAVRCGRRASGRARWWTTRGAVLVHAHGIWGEYMALGNMSFAAPSAVIGGGGFQGRIKDVKLTLGGKMWIDGVHNVR
ncbi:glycoside hydrolase [Epithele typhae]|uniref:glycoside hydrolase n=1 Tax=Epithele typhae TaxID=378194 RepID=UPI00200771A1|nr:glycoside hydrolase [Epithele typhae]KAH9914641.1 glycoside hydrolase [Epithele typhae]